MTYYKSIRLCDGKPRWVVTDRDGTIIDRNPSKELLRVSIVDMKRKGSIPKDRKCYICGNLNTYIMKDGRVCWYKAEIDSEYMCQNCHDLIRIYGTTVANKIQEMKYQYFKTKLDRRICCICGNNKTYRNIRGGYDWFKHKCGSDNCTGFLCRECYVRYDPNGSSSTKKSMSSIRRGYLDITSSTGKGIIGELIVGRARNIANYNIISDNFNSHIDLVDDILGRINVKLSTLDTVRERWTFNPRLSTDIDTYILIGMDEYINKWDNIKIVLTIPQYEDIINVDSISIFASRLYNYDKYFTDIESYNNTYHKLKKYIKDKKWIGIEDMKRFLIERD